MAHGTPLYRVVPSSSEEMAEYEPYLDRAKHKIVPTSASDGTAEPPKKSKKRKKKRRDDDASADEREAKREGNATPAASATTVTTPASLAPDAGAPQALPTLPSGDAGAVSERHLIPDAGADAGDDENKPWWQKKYEPGKGPRRQAVGPDGRANRVMARRMVKGFYVAVDQHISR